MTAYMVKEDLIKTVENLQVFADTGTTKSWEVYANALTHTIIVVVPAFTNAITVVLSITNSDSNEIYASGSLAKGTTHIIASEKPLIGKHTMLLTLSGAAGGTGGTVKTTLYLQG